MVQLTFPLPFFEAIESLRALKNSTWALHSSPDSESLYEQMYQMALVCLAHPDLSGEDEANAIMMCMVHDVGHIASGEVTLVDDERYPKGTVEEEIGLKHLTYLLKESSPALAERLPDALLEYQICETRVAKLVHQVDKFESLHQAVIRRKNGLRVRGKDDLDTMRESITDPWLAKQADDITAEDWDALDETAGSRAPIIFVIGGPGLGEHTHCDRIAEEFNLEHVSVDDTFREEQNRPGSIFGRFIKESIDNFANIPPSLAIMLLKSKVKGIQSTGRGVLISGFPQCVGQVVVFENEMPSPSICALPVTAHPRRTPDGVSSASTFAYTGIDGSFGAAAEGNQLCDAHYYSDYSGASISDAPDITKLECAPRCASISGCIMMAGGGPVFCVLYQRTYEEAQLRPLASADVLLLSDMSCLPAP
ncbi:hypothetical protein G7Z17_g4144 [Cylindrodendrum hubeiense]|uniref:HD domain-containing protein n=1 Tax=Cylindrodendrum hubeiense TaxID=595255 RepID=A0A9P5H9D5_9HYPO|nr:hypothetical protein G7Z17_g4144 [Cylindrodendrum hubeiense]